MHLTPPPAKRKDPTIQGPQIPTHFGLIKLLRRPRRRAQVSYATQQPKTSWGKKPFKLLMTFARSRKNFGC